METEAGFLIYAALYRLSIIAAGVVSIVLGYLLFVRGVMPERGADIDAKLGRLKFVIRNAGPGTCFALFGVVIISVMAVDGRPQLELERLNRPANGADGNSESVETVHLRGEQDSEGLAAFNALVDVGDELRAAGDETGAMAAYGRALTYPEVTLGAAAVPLGRIVDLYLNQDRESEALPLARLAFATHRNSPDVLDRLARVLLQVSKPADALTAARAAIERAPDVAAFRHTLALCLQATGDRAGAIEEMQLAAEQDPRFAEDLAMLRRE